MENFAYLTDPDQINDINKVTNRDVLAVDVRNVEFQYNSKHKVLNKLCLQIPRGRIIIHTSIIRHKRPSICDNLDAIRIKLELDQTRKIRNMISFSVKMLQYQTRNSIRIKYI